MYKLIISSYHASTLMYLQQVGINIRNARDYEHILYVVSDYWYLSHW